MHDPSAMPLHLSHVPPLHLLRATLRLLLWLTHLLIANTLLSLLLPLSPLLPSTTYDLSSHIASTVWSHIQRIFTHHNGARIRVTGDPLPPGESAIVISNHVEWTDFYPIQELALRAGMLGRCRWFAKKELKWVPFLGWGLWAMGMPLVSRNWTRDQKEMDKVFAGVVEKKWPMCMYSDFPFAYAFSNLHEIKKEHKKKPPQPNHISTSYFPFFLYSQPLKRFNYCTNPPTQPLSSKKGLISFSESTRLTPRKRAQATAHALANNKSPPPPHLLLPRTKGFAACVRALRAAPHVSAVYDVTVAYAERAERSEVERSEAEPREGGNKKKENGDMKQETLKFQSPPSFAESVFLPRIGARWEIVVHVRRFDLRELPREEEGLKGWLEERWREKGVVLEGLRRELEGEGETGGKMKGV